MSQDTKRCLNCGTPLSDTFCPHCGQKASVARLTVKTAIVDTFWSVLRMDGRVVPTAALLVTRPWIVIRNYIHGHRVMYTQPARFIIIMCFVNILLQLVFGDLRPEENVLMPAPEIADDASVWTRGWYSLLDFLNDSEIARDLVESVVLTPIVYLLYMHWGSRRYNFAEYCTAYLYMCGAAMVIDTLALPLNLVSVPLNDLVETVWWIYLMCGMVKHAFRFNNRRTLLAMLTVTGILLVGLGVLLQYFFFDLTT